MGIGVGQRLDQVQGYDDGTAIEFRNESDSITALAADRARALGHTLTERHFVARSGSLFRQHQALETAAIIGWNFRSTWFQRRAGLTTLSATTAGGSQSVTALDVPEADAVAVSMAAAPTLVAQFLASG